MYAHDVTRQLYNSQTFQQQIQLVHSSTSQGAIGL